MLTLLENENLPSSGKHSHKISQWSGLQDDFVKEAERVCNSLGIIRYKRWILGLLIFHIVQLKLLAV